MSTNRPQPLPLITADLRVLVGSRLSFLLVLVPVSVLLSALSLPPQAIFVTSAIAVVPLAGIIGTATEQLAARMGSTAGGLLNATFGNATELIIALLALNAGLPEVVKASISGSIIGNILLVLGLGMFAGGWKHGRQRFDRTAAGASATMLFLAVVALVMPAVFDLTVFGSLSPTGATVERLSLLVAAVLIAIYLASLVFSLKTHTSLFSAADETAGPNASLRASLVVLATATALAALEAELLVQSISEASASLGMTELFIGVVVVAIVGNAAEHFSAVVAAAKNKMNLSVTIATGSATQVALFVAPVLVFASWAIGRPLSLVFNAFEIVAIALSVLALAMVSLDGESNWFEGLQLVAVYVVLGIVFYFVPAM